MDFEKSFSNFLESKEYDQSESALFTMLRIAFKSGWIAAGGEELPVSPENTENTDNV